MAKLTVERIAEMTDMQVLMLTVPRPDAPGQRGFMFSLRDFESRKEMAACMAALTMRLQKIEK